MSRRAALARLAWPAWNAAERRPRAPVRLVLFALALGLAAAGIGRALGRLGPRRLDRLLGPVPGDVAAAVGGPAAVLCLLALAAAALDRRRLRDYGLGIDRDWWLDFGAGLLLGATLMTLVFAVESAAGWAAVVGTARAAGPRAFPAAFLAVTVRLLGAGAVEELLVRGYALTNLAEGCRALGPRRAAAVATLGSSALFGALHAGNPNATAASTAAVALGGVMLALAYVLTGELGLPIGLHVAWNLFQGPVYGYPVSGVDLGVSALVLARSGPRVATGGAFGPEAGLTGVGAMAVGIAAVVGYARRRRGRGTAPVAVPALRWWRWARPAARDGGERGGTG
ncbi:MAG: lysostaphin resistance A-like protein [Haloferacaceae archaeon]